MAWDSSNSTPRRPFLEIIALMLWLGGYHLNFVVILICLCFITRVWAFTILALYVGQVLIPTFSDTTITDGFARFLCKYGPGHFPVHVHVEDMDALDSKRSYVVAAEPHSVFPVGIIALTKHYGALPLKNIKVAGSSALLWTPVVRFVWSWLGLVSARKHIFSELLKSGSSVIVVPGGVQECLYMEPGQETIFLKNRYGFVRCAIEAGSPLVPVFCFGQSEAYHYMKPSGKWYTRLSRAIGFTPLLFWGMYGTPIPFRHPMHIVVGKPIDVERNPTPSRDEISKVLGKFIVAMEVLFERHKEAAGYKDTTLRVL